MVERFQGNPYHTLGVEPDANESEIKAAYRRLALKFHPDRNPGDKQAEERFKQVSAAYAVLRDGTSRLNYDRYGTRPETESFGANDWRVIFQEADLRINTDFPNGTPRTGNMMFDALFSAVTGAMRSSGLLPGKDLHADVNVPLSVGRNGGLHRVQVPGPSVCPECRGSALNALAVCRQCRGRRQVQRAEVDLKIPSGIRDRTKLRLKGLGGLGTPPGDALFTIHLQIPNGVRRQGNDLHANLYLTPLEALQGIRTQCVGLDINIPQGVRDRQTLVFKNKGISDGDLFLKIRFDVWRGVFRGLREYLKSFKLG